MVNELPEDKILICKSCQKEFMWGMKEQAYYKKKGFSKQPQKCNQCRVKANKLRDGAMFYVHCGICEKDGATLSPPPKDQVAICKECFEKLSETKKA